MMQNKAKFNWNLDDLAHQAMVLRGFEADFTQEVLDQLNALNEPVPMSAGPTAKDLRDKLWFSIDNDDSKDLDQLTFAEVIAGGITRIYVSIADVTTLVTRDCPIDKHAAKNTTSVYTPTLVFPMLPPKLSTNLTSLNENQERLSIVVEIDVTQKGAIQRYEVYQAYVRNKAKLAYDSVGNWLETEKDAPPAVEQNKDLADLIILHDQITTKLKAYRESKGMLSLKTIEVRSIIQNHDVIDLVVVQKNRARDIIENFMIAANSCVTKFLHAKNFPAFRRVVKEPKKWPRIVVLAQEKGAKLPPVPDAVALEHFLLDQQKKDPETFPDLSLAIVKLLGRGEYVIDMPDEPSTGHFGLALRHYSHATAPNRRYPDLITQRLIKAVLNGQPNPYAFNELVDLAAYCTEKEGDSDKVTRQMQKSAAAILLSSKIGTEYDAIVTGDNERGTWVRTINPPVDGKLVKGGAGLDIGDRLSVKLVAVDVPNGYIDFSKI